ncbi:carboxypeptidase B-like [Drosophila eugracilis]|uniref:carboxypeptidase B-like n=1 Tax=Drosophila eugracilis TaxID=29029 RepID=UPI0007E78BF7|nr:carboxypeptidase B-like [Drosophila eugracilis]
MCKALYAIIFLAAIVSPLAESGRIRKRNIPKLKLGVYPTYNEVLEYLNQLALTYSDRVTLKDVGRSYEGRSLTVAMITNGDGRPGKRVIFLDAALHSREWMTPITALYVIQKLVVEFEDNSDLLRDFDWHIMPLANPDGYEYSRNMNRYWRNTRTPNGRGCIGTNLNRNFEVGWGVGFPELRDPCDENYAGSAPFSEVEARTVRDIMHSLVESNRAAMYLSLHTANRSVFYPWVYDTAPVPNKEEHDEIAKFVSRKILESTGTVIKPRQASQYAGAFGGTSMDYAYHAGFPLSFVFEMSGTGRNGMEYKFFPPVSEIRYLADESWTGIRAFAEKVIELYPPSRQVLYSQKLMLTGSAAPQSRVLDSKLGAVILFFAYFINNI